MNNHILYRQLDLPAFQNRVYETQEEALSAPRGNVELVQCDTTGLVYNRLFVPGTLVYDGDYENEQAHSDHFRLHLEQVASIVLKHYPTGALGVEVGCGKGSFLEMLLARKANFFGFDTSYVGTNPRIRKEYFGERSVSPAPHFVVLRHVLEHIYDPWSFLAMLRDNCEIDTKIYIEVPTLDWIVAHDAFYDVFYEHVNYFTLETLSWAFGTILQSGTVFGDQYIFIVANLTTFTRPSAFHGKRFAPLLLDQRLNHLAARLNSHNRRRYLWGAGAKGATAADILTRRGVRLAGLLDINPRKCHRFAGGSGLPIHSPDVLLGHASTVDIVVMNPNYKSEIERLVVGLDVQLIDLA